MSFICIILLILVLKIIYISCLSIIFKMCNVWEIAHKMKPVHQILTLKQWSYILGDDYKIGSNTS